MSGKQHTKNQHTVPKCYLQAWAHGEKGKEKIWVLDVETKKIEEKKLVDVTVIKDFYETNFLYLSKDEEALAQYRKEIKERLIKPLKKQIELFPEDYHKFLEKRFEKFLKILEQWQQNPSEHEKILDNAIETELFAKGIEEHAAKVLKKIQESGTHFPDLSREEECSLCLFIASQYLRSDFYREKKVEFLHAKKLSARNLSLLIGPQILSLARYFLDFFSKDAVYQHQIISSSEILTSSNPAFPICCSEDEKLFRKSGEELEKLADTDDIDKIIEHDYSGYKLYLFPFPLSSFLLIYFMAQEGSFKKLSKERIDLKIDKSFLQQKEVFGKEKSDLERMLDALIRLK